MIKKFAAAAFVAGACVSFAAVAQAEDFPAAPMNHGPMMMTGMGPVGDVVNLGLMPANVLARPVITTTGAVVGAAPMAEPAPMAEEKPMMHHRHHHHMMSKKMMMKKKMMAQ